LTTAIEPREPRDRANSRSPCALSLGSLGSIAVVNRAQGFSIAIEPRDSLFRQLQ